MPIAGLDNFLHASRLLQTAPLSALRETRLGIDLSLYLRLLLSSPRTSEPLVAALGGAPLALISHIETDLRALEKARIKPVFVLSGLPPAKKARPFAWTDDRRSEDRRTAWEHYEEGDVDAAHDFLSKSHSVREQDLIRAVLRAFRHRNVEFLVAPYSADGQLVSLERHSKSYVHAVYGSSSLFLFDRVDKLILSLDLQELSAGTGTGTFTFASKPALLASLGCNEEEFLDLGLLCGFDHCPTFPPFIDGSIPNVMMAPIDAAAGASAGSNSAASVPNIRSALEVLKQYRSGFTLCSAFDNHPSCAKLNYTDAFCRARCMVKFALVTSAEEGRVLPLPLATPIPPVAPVAVAPNAAAPLAGALIAPGLNGASPAVAQFAPNGVGAPLLTAADVPSDLHDVFSHRLPDEVFLHLSRGLIQPTVLTHLTSGHIVENAPLSPDTPEEYKHFIRNALTETPHSPRCVALALMAGVLNGFWSSRRIVATYWWEPTRDYPVHHDNSDTLELIKRVAAWNVGVEFVEEELRRQNSSFIDIALCLGSTTHDSLAIRTKTPRAAKPPHAPAGGAAPLLEKKDEVVANVIWRFLELRGFLNHDHLHTPYARALHLGLKVARVNDRVQEPLFIALELMRAGALHGNPFGGRVLSGGPAYGDADAPGEEGEEAREARSHLLLIMRCLSLLPMNFKSAPWTAPLSRELLLFASFSKQLTRSLRALVEAIASSLLLRGDGRRARDDYLDISLSLPFHVDANTGLGIIVKCYLEALLTFNGGRVKEGEESSEEVREAVEAVLEMIESTFDNVKNVRQELQRGFRFWDALMKAAQTLTPTGDINPALLAQFQAADAWLKPMTKI